MSRIDRMFSAKRSEGQGALICYLMAGVPNEDRFIEYCEACIRGGADLLEVGVPYSDPVADGVVIQNAGVLALDRGVTPRKVMEMVKDLRKRTDVPIVLMGYYNPIFRRGEEMFVDDCIDAGVDGIIVPDLPLHEGTDLRNACMRRGLDLIQLTTPLTGDERNSRLMDATSGFLYLVARKGVTGKGTGTSDELPHMISRCREHDRSVNIATGFGINDVDDVRRIMDLGPDAAIVGSALVAMTLDDVEPKMVEEKVRALSSACHR